MRGEAEGARERGTYLVELYVSAKTVDDFDELAARAAAVTSLAGEGHGIRYLRSIFIRDDDTCFHLYQAASPLGVSDALERARLDYERIVEVVELEPVTPELGLRATNLEASPH